MDNDKLYYDPSSCSTYPSFQTAVKTERKSVKLTKRDFIFTALFALLSFVIVDFILLHGLNLGFTLAYLALFVISTVYLFDKNNKPSIFTCICGALSLVGSVSFALYHDYFINFVMLILVLGLFTIYTCGLSNTFSYNQGSYKIFIDMLLGIIAKPFSNADEIKNGYVDNTKKGGNIKNIIIGIAISLPVLLVVIPLLISSDEAFGNLVMLVLKNIGTYLVELAIAAVVFVYIVLYFVTKKKRLGYSQGKKLSHKGVLPMTVSITFMTMISLVYITYLFSQLAYFFSAFSGILPKGYELTASEFARRGFFEMFAICAINIVVITLVTILTKKTGKKPVMLKLISSFIMLFTVLLLVTAIAKMKLNIDIFGLSKNRIMVCVFMLMMLVAIAFYILHIINPKINYMQSVVVICSVIFIALAFCNVDARIAEYNINAYEEKKIDTLDVNYIANLSDSTMPYLIELAKSDDKEISLTARYRISTAISDYDNLDNDFREYNYTRNNAKKLVDDYYHNYLSLEDREYFLCDLEQDYRKMLAEKNNGIELEVE